ncbi:MAG: hypothetical protein MJ094_07015 [Saccharofermentans sp.]|nr:hypothetical protein [Saccharofermentans sp.]
MEFEIKLLHKLRQQLIREEWNIAIRPLGKDRLYQIGGIKEKFIVIPNSFRYWCADPFIVSVENIDYLFFEMFDRFRGKGVIGYREIFDGKIGKMKTAYEAPYHLSFPCICKVDKEWYMIPEYSEGKEIPILQATHFPDCWEKVESWMTGQRCVDSVIIKHQNQEYLFTQKLKKGYHSNTLEIFIHEGDEWIPHCKNPVVASSSDSRLAGKIFMAENKLIRVAQDCSDGYGKSLHFREISVLNHKEFVEQGIADINVNNISIDGKKHYVGIHTYNSSNHYEVIDLKNHSHVSLGNLVNLFWCIIKKVFH